jgi:pilus assembly protein Flp/PilA
MYGILAKLTALRYDKRAVTALEYGLIASLIAVAIIGAVSSLGSNLSSTFSTIASHFASGKVTT